MLSKAKGRIKEKGIVSFIEQFVFIYLYFGEIGCVTSPNSTVCSVLTLTLTLTQTSSSLTSYENKSRCFSKSFTILARERKNPFFLLLLEREGRSRRRERGYLPHVLLGRDINFAADSPGLINKFWLPFFFNRNETDSTRFFLTVCSFQDPFGWVLEFELY